MALGAETAHLERVAVVVAEKAIALFGRMSDERRESFVGHLDAVILGGSLPHTTLETLAVDEQAVHVTHNGSGAIGHHELLLQVACA